MVAHESIVAQREVEPKGGIEPPNKGFADLGLTTWLFRLEWGEFGAPCWI